MVFKYFFTASPKEEISLSTLLADKSLPYKVQGEVFDITEHRPVAIFLDDDAPSFKAAGLHKAATLTKKSGVAAIEHGRMAGESICLTCNNQIITELSNPVSGYGNLNKKTLLSFKSFPLPQIVKGRVLKLSDLCNDNYFHFLIYVLPSIFLTNKYTIDFIYCPGAAKFHTDYMKLLSIPQEKVIPAYSFCHFECSELICSQGGVFHPGCVNILANNLRQYMKLQPVARQWPEKFYISRQDSRNGRKLTNEDELLEFLGKQGFSAVVLSEFSVQEQIALFMNAKFIVSVHGAGLTNGIYCNPGTKFIEITHGDYINVSQLQTSNRNHDMVWATILAQLDTSNIKNMHLLETPHINCFADIHLDIAKFEKLYHKIDAM